MLEDGHLAIDRAGSGSALDPLSDVALALSLGDGSQRAGEGRLEVLLTILANVLRCAV